jgi:uncharacterized glyoxalase superfamily protein PhnB
VDGADATIEFLVEVFGAVEVRRFADPKGKVLHAEVRIDDTVVMVGNAADGWPPVDADASAGGRRRECPSQANQRRS